jgi:glycosyltransferase involved in cell wall biosynthesis
MAWFEWKDGAGKVNALSDKSMGILTGEIVNLHSTDFPPVTVMLSTFNGGNYVKPQLDSVLAQSYPNIHIKIRDDGSSDGTPASLQEYVQHHANISVVFGNNIGAVRSFMALLKQQEHAEGYFAFCDQDDVWRQDKIARAVRAIQSSEDPAGSLYFSRLELVNQGNAQTQLSDVPARISFNNAIVENVVTGATAVFGSRIKNLMLMGRPECMVWHDWWLYLVASAFGNLIYDDEPAIRYRRHDHTLTNLRVRSRESMIAKLKAFVRVARRKRAVSPFEQAVLFGTTYQPLLNQRQLALIGKIAQLHDRRRFLDRARFVFDRDFVVNDRLDDLGLRLLVLFGVV